MITNPNSQGAVIVALQGLERRGFIQQWSVNRDFQGFGWILRLQYPDNCGRDFFLENEILNNPNAIAAFIESVQRAVMDDIKNAAIKIPRSYLKPYRDDVADAPKKQESPKAKPLSPSNAYRFDYVELVEIKEAK